MKKVIVVRIKKAHRETIRFLLVLMVCAAISVCLLWAPYLLSFLLFVPIILAVFFMVLYDELWQISFGASKITVKRLFFREKTYTYDQITDVYAAHSYTLHEHICITFSDGKSVRFRADDENAGQARRRILSHHTIRMANW